jgi:hypothetical protein
MTLRAFSKQNIANRKSSSEKVTARNAAAMTTAMAITGGAAGPSSYVFTISPAVNGKTTWDVAVDGALSLANSGTWTIIPTYTYSLNVVMWGAGGGSVSYGANYYGGGGGSSNGFVTLSAGVSYDFIVGEGGNGVAANRNAAGGGGGTGIQFTSNTTPILVAGGGGGGYSIATRRAGAGGGSSGQNGETAGAGGYGGSQSAAGAGGNGGRRTGASGSGRNGGGGAMGPVVATGGAGFGTGGGGDYNASDAGSGGGGGGYFGGGQGGGDAGGYGGGGGSGYFNPSVVTNGSTNAGEYETAANYVDVKRPTVGGVQAGASVPNGYKGANGAIVLTIT